MNKQNEEIDIYVCLTIFHTYVSLLNILNNKKQTLLILTDNIVDVDKLQSAISNYIEFIDIVVIDNLKSKSKIVNSLKNRIFYYDFFFFYYMNFIQKYDDILSKNTINIFNDTEYFNMYLIKKYNNFNLLEDGVWMHPLLKKDLKFFVKYYLLRQPKKFGNDKKIKNIIVQDIKRLPEYLHVKGKIYSLFELQKKLCTKDITILKKIFLSDFGIDAIKNSSKKKMVILTQPISEENYITKQEKIKVYTDIIKKYNKNNDYIVFIKNHPRDLTNYDEYLDDVIIIPHYIPFEILTLENKIHFDIGITLWSSSIYNVDFIEEKIFLGQEYIDDISKRKVH